MKNSTIYKSGIQQAQLALGFRTFGIDDGRHYAAAVLDSILGRGMMSRLFQELREKRGLTYDISSRMHFFQDCGMMAITAGVDPKKRDLALKTIEKVIEKLCTTRVSAAELKRNKEYLIGNFRLSHEKLTSRLFFYGSTFLAFNRVVTTAEQIEGVRTVTADDILNVAKAIFKRANRSICWVLPEKSPTSNGHEN